MQREIEQQYQEKLRRKKKITIIAILIVILAVLITVGIIIFSVVISPSMKYNQAISDFNNRNYLEAAELFSKQAPIKIALTIYKIVSKTSTVKRLHLATILRLTRIKKNLLNGEFLL